MNDVVLVASIVVIGLLFSTATGILDVFSNKPIPTGSIFSNDPPPPVPLVLPRGYSLSPPLQPRRERRGYVPVKPKSLFDDTDPNSLIGTVDDTFNPNSLVGTLADGKYTPTVTSLGGKKRKTRRKTRRV